MKAIGVRELRQNASAYLKQVEAGQVVEVTAHGRSVALLVPATPSGRRQALMARGRLVPGTGNLVKLGPPLRATRGVPLPTDILKRNQSEER